MAPAPMTVAPTPVTTVPAPVVAVSVMSPAHLFRFHAVHLVSGDNGEMGILVPKRHPLIFGKRLWGKGYGVRACGQRGGARGYSKGEFQKVAAFHDVSSFALGT